jgi:hypothetical protein
LRFDTVFKGTNICEGQVVQEQIDSFCIYVVPGRDFSSHDLTKIEHNMKLHVGNVRIKVSPVAVIPRTESGKFKAVICKLSPDEKANATETLMIPS